MNKIVITFLLIVSVFILYFSNKIVEGLDAPSSILSPAPLQTDIKTKASTDTALERFTSALVSAFSPPSTVSSNSIAKHAWTNDKAIANTVTPIIDSPAGCKSKTQVAVEPLPVDVQAQSTIANHAKNIISTLDEYELQLKKIEDILTKPKTILALNKNVESVVNLGIPSVSVVYDENSNSLINLSVVKGISGDKGIQPDPISGIPKKGDIGVAGVDGINPIGKSIETLPYWAKN
jgi:hypothetical protein